MGTLRFFNWRTPDGEPVAQTDSSAVPVFSQAIQAPTPVFYGTSNHSITNAVYTTSTLSAAIDTYGWFNAGNYRYTPQIAGYYRVTTLMTGTSASNNVTAIIVVAAKNDNHIAGRVYRCPASNNMSGYADVLVYMNGTTDYLTWIGWISGTSPTLAMAGSAELMQRGPA